MPIDITDLPRRVQYVINGTGPYNFEFEVVAQTDIAVYSDATLLALGTNYAVTLNADGSGYVQLVSATGTTLTILGARAYKRTTTFATAGDFKASTVNLEFNSMQIQLLQLREESSRSIKTAPHDTSTVSAELPAARSNTFLFFDSVGNATTSLGTGADAGLRTDLAATTGSALVGHTDTGTGAGTVSLLTLLRGRVYPVIYGYSPVASAANNALAVVRAMNMTGTRGGRLIFPRYDGAVAMAPDTLAVLQRNITFEGDSSAMGYEASLGGVLWQFTVGNYGIDCTHTNARHFAIENIVIDGNDVLNRGIWAGGAFIIDGVHVQKCLVAGYDFYELVNSAKVRDSSAFDNAIGLLIGSASGGNNTTMSLDNFISRQNVTGIRIVNGRNVNFYEGTVESNTGNGLEVVKLPGILCNDIHFTGTHFEENWQAAAGYQVLITGTTPGTDRPSRITFDRCPMNATLPTKAIHVLSGESVEIRNPGEMTSGSEITFAAGAQFCKWENIPSGVTIVNNGTRNYEEISSRGSYSTTLTGIAGTDPAFTVEWTIVNGLIHLSIPATTGTSDTTAKTLTGLPAALWPGIEVVHNVAMSDAGGTAALGRATIGTNGVITLQPTPAGGTWTASGTFSSVKMDLSYMR